MTAIDTSHYDHNVIIEGLDYTPSFPGKWSATQWFMHVVPDKYKTAKLHSIDPVTGEEVFIKFLKKDEVHET